MFLVGKWDTEDFGPPLLLSPSLGLLPAKLPLNFGLGQIHKLWFRASSPALLQHWGEGVKGQKGRAGLLLEAASACLLDSKASFLTLDALA